MKDHPLEPHWPIQKLREHDLWFHNEFPIQAYRSDGRVAVEGHGDMVMLGGYSYLGLNGHPKINRAAHDAIDRFGTGAHGARLLAGTLTIHKALEAKIAAFKGTEAAVAFSSGYMANLSAISALVGRHDTVICDKLDHASIVDGCTLSQAKFVRFPHNDLEQLERRLTDPQNTGRRLVIVDAVYSMDGDLADLPGISRLCQRHGATLMVDEAHATGVLGRMGHGIEEHYGLPADCIDIKMGTFSKAIPSAGGYIAGSRRMCEFLSLQARGFIYSGALPPASAAAALAALEIIEEEPERVACLHRNRNYFARALRETGFSYLRSQTAVLPVLCGEDWQAWRMARACQRRGVFVQAIPHPVVPKGTARLRAAVSAAHSRADLDFCLAALRESAEEVGGILPASVPVSPVRFSAEVCTLRV